MVRMSRAVVVLAIFAAIHALSGCGDQRESIGVMGAMVNHTDCKTLSQLPRAAAASQDCLVWQYNGQDSLQINHVNAGFNCCPGELTADITVENKVITIREKEREAGCSCLCLFDLTYKFENLEPGPYRIQVVEPYVQASDLELDFTVDLSTQPSGQHCVTRTYYPWE
ncbi:MAG: hypothetical protein AB1714_25570 [Acidobacteriota bacterium]